MAEQTRVEYDVSQAIAELDRLNKKVKESGQVAEDSFDEAGEGAESFSGALSGISPAASGAASAITRLAAAAGPGGVAVAAVGAALTALANQIINVPELLKDTNAQLEQLKTSGRAAQELADLASAIGDSLADFQFETRQESVRRRQIALADQQNELEVARQTIQERLAIEREKFRQLEAQARDSARSREQLERDLQRRLEDQQVAAAGEGTTQARGVGELAGLAEEAALEGNVDLANRFLEKARSISQELGNHSFFLRQIEDAQNTVNDAQEEQLRQAKRTSQEDRASAASQRRVVEQLERQLKARENSLRALQRENRALSAERTEIRTDRRERRRADDAAQGARDLATAQAELQRLGEAGLSARDAVVSVGRGLSDLALKSGPEIQSISEEFGTIRQLADRAFSGVETGTIESVRQSVLDSEEATRRLGELMADVNFPSGLVEQAERVLSGLDSVQRAGVGAERAARAGVGPDERIQTGARRLENASKVRRLEFLIQRDAEKAADSSKRFADELNRAASSARIINQNLAGSVPNVPAASTGLSNQSVAQPTAAVAATAAPVAQTLNVTANVRGGIIDRETTESILDIVRREVRKLTSEGTSSSVA